MCDEIVVLNLIILFICITLSILHDLLHVQEGGDFTLEPPARFWELDSILSIHVETSSFPSIARCEVKKPLTMNLGMDGSRALLSIIFRPTKEREREKKSFGTIDACPKKNSCFSRRELVEAENGSLYKLPDQRFSFWKILKHVWISSRAIDTDWHNQTARINSRSSVFLKPF